MDEITNGLLDIVYVAGTAVVGVAVLFIVLFILQTKAFKWIFKIFETYILPYKEQYTKLVEEAKGYYLDGVITIDEAKTFQQHLTEVYCQISGKSKPGFMTQLVIDKIITQMVELANKIGSDKAELKTQGLSSTIWQQLLLNLGVKLIEVLYPSIQDLLKKIAEEALKGKKPPNR